MRRDELEHVIRAAAAIAGEREIVVIGELSPFHETFRYHAHGVGPATAILPAGWEDRLVKVQGLGTGDSIGYCLDPCDLAASKLAAGREKDLAFVAGLLRHRIVTAGEVLARVEKLPLDPGRRQAIAQRVVAMEREAGRAG